MGKRKWVESTPRCCLSLKLQSERIYMPVPPVLARRTRSFIYLRHLARSGKGRRQPQEAAARAPRRFSTLMFNDMFQDRLGTPEAMVLSRDLVSFATSGNFALKSRRIPEKCRRGRNFVSY